MKDKNSNLQISNIAITDTIIKVKSNYKTSLNNQSVLKIAHYVFTFEQREKQLQTTLLCCK